jgi:hypothetical protein
MPAIRLADIPNAGPQSAGVSSNILAPQAAQLGSAATVSTRPLDNAARSMLTQPLELDAFSQEARAAGRFAEAIGGLGDVAQKWGQKFAEAKDASDISKAEMVLQSSWEKQQNEQLGTPVEKWGELWSRNQEEAKRQLGEIKFSNNAAEKINPYFERWSTLSTIKMDGLAKKQEINGFRSTMESNAYKKIATGDYEGAFLVMDESAKKGLHTPEEVTVWKSKLFDDQIRYARQQQKENITMSITADPRGTIEKLDRAAKGEKTDFGDLQPTQVAYYKNLATRQDRSNQAENWNSLVEKIQNGDIASKDQLKKEADGMRIDPAKYKRLENAIAATISFDPKVAGDLKAKVAGFDFSSDQNDKNFYELKNEIVSRLPKDHAQLLVGELDSGWKKSLDGTPKSPREVYRSDFIQGIKRIGDSGLLGETGLDKDGKTIVDQSTNNTYNARVYSVMQGMDDWFNNPANKDKTPADAQQHRDSLIEPLLKGKALELFKQKSSSAFQPSTGMQTRMMDRVDQTDFAKPMPTPPPAKDAIDKAKSIKAEGKVTYYNFPGDKYSDSNSRNLIGAWNNKLDKDSLAISPDIERKFKAAGIGKGDAVELTLADGSTVIRNWDDRTMQDEQATRKFGKPLTGRFDFHSPGGKQKNDGMAVVSFRKATNA